MVPALFKAHFERRKKRLYDFPLNIWPVVFGGTTQGIIWEIRGVYIQKFLAASTLPWPQKRTAVFCAIETFCPFLLCALLLLCSVCAPTTERFKYYCIKKLHLAWNIRIFAIILTRAFILIPMHLQCRTVYEIANFTF